MAVWEGHRDGAGPEDGRDVAVATRTDGAWSEPAYLTDATERGHHEPTVAAADDRVAAAWATVELAEEADSLGGIEVVVDDGDGWGEPVTLIDGDELDRLPALEPLGDDRWVVAWERTRPEGLAVVSAVIDDRGEVLTQETIEAAERPALAATDDGVALIYYDRAGEQVRRERLSAATEREPVAAYDAPTVEALAAGADVTAWIADAGPEPVVECATNGGDSSELTFPEAVSRVTTLDVVETARGTAVVYRRIVDDEAQSSFGYRLRRDGEWRPDRPFVAGRPDVTVWKPAVVPNAADDGFVAVLTGESRSDDGVADLFAVAHRFHATYELAHVDGPTGVAPGEAVTIEYTLHNVGELAGTEAVTVVARSDGEILAETTDEPLEPGQTAAGQLSVTLDETGTVDVLAAPGLSVSDPAPDVARASVTISTPALSVADVTLERPAADEASADVTVANDGPIDADGVGFALRSGDRLIAAGRVDGVPATGTAAATVAVDPAVVDDHVAEEIRLDPDDDLPASHVADPIASVLLGQPELVIDDRIAYHVVGSHVVARLLVVNAGTRATETTVRAIRAGAVPSADGFDDDVLLGTTTVTLPPTVGDTERAVSVEVPVGTVEEGDRLQFVLEPDRPVAGPGIPVVEDEVGTLFGGADDVSTYADEDGIVRTDGLRNAIDDWRSGAVDTDLLRDTIDAWRTGETIV